MIILDEEIKITKSREETLYYTLYARKEGETTQHKGGPFDNTYSLAREIRRLKELNFAHFIIREKRTVEWTVVY
jgi:hypothetical protein